MSKTTQLCITCKSRPSVANKDICDYCLLFEEDFFPAWMISAEGRKNYEVDIEFHLRARAQWKREAAKSQAAILAKYSRV